MGYKEGEDLVVNFKYPFQHFNRIKNHWRQSGPKAALTDAVPGMLVSDEDDDKLWHKTGDSIGWDEALQEMNSFDARPVFSRLTLDVEAADVSDPPTEAELDVVFTSPASMGEGQHVLLLNTHSGGKLYLVVSDGSSYWTFQGALAV